MPAKSEAQQRLFGMALALKRSGKSGSGQVAALANSMSEKKLKEFAATKHEGLPEKAAAFLMKNAAWATNLGEPAYTGLEHVGGGENDLQFKLKKGKGVWASAKRNLPVYMGGILGVLGGGVAGLSKANENGLAAPALGALLGGLYGTGAGALYNHLGGYTDQVRREYLGGPARIRALALKAITEKATPHDSKLQTALSALADKHADIKEDLTGSKARGRLFTEDECRRRGKEYLAKLKARRQDLNLATFK